MPQEAVATALEAHTDAHVEDVLSTDATVR